MSRAYDGLIDELFGKSKRAGTVEEYRARIFGERVALAGGFLLGAVMLCLFACTCVGVYTVFTWMFG